MKTYIFILIILTGCLFSCKKSWLEVVPQGRLVASTTDDYDKLMNDRNFYIFNELVMSEVQLMGDELAIEGAFFIQQSTQDVRDLLFRWEGAIYAVPGLLAPTITTETTQMYQINKIINEVMGSEGGTSEKKKAIQGEALATRALWNFIMANYYCKPYNAATADKDPGFPFIKQSDVTISEYPRGNLQQTYDLIIKDLTDALAAVPVKPAIVTRMSRPAVEGLLGKVYLFMGKYNEALPLLKAALADVIANGQTSLYDYNKEFGPTGKFLPIDNYLGPVNAPGQNIADVREAIVSKTFFSGLSAFVLAPEAQILYDPSDLRLKFYTNKNPDNSINAAGHLRKYGVNYSRFGLQLPELYLLLAECKARTGDLSGATADVETLRKNRMPLASFPVPPATAASQVALVKFIIDERIREFAMESVRWFDMRRLSLDPIFAGKVYTHTIFNANNTTTVITLNQPDRFVLKFPREFMDANPGMANNP